MVAYDKSSEGKDVLLDSGRLFEPKTGRRMKCFCFSINERVFNALCLVAERMNKSASFIARVWLDETAKIHRLGKFDPDFLRKSCEDIVRDRNHDFTIALSNRTVTELNKAKDKLSCNMSGLATFSILLGLKQFAQRHADPSLRAEIERVLFGERKAEALEDKEGIAA